jgi:hypothetical protein
VPRHLFCRSIIVSISTYSPLLVFSARPQLHLSMYAFVGKLLGMSIRGKHALNLDWPSAVWKLLVGGAAAAGTSNAASASASSSLAESTVDTDASAAASGKHAASSTSDSSSSSPSSSSPSSSPSALSTFTMATVSVLDRTDLEGCDILCVTALNKISGLEAEFSGSGDASASASSSTSSASASASSGPASASASALDADNESSHSGSGGSEEATEDAATRASRALDELGYTFTTVSVDGRVVELVPGGARIRYSTSASAVVTRSHMGSVQKHQTKANHC